MLKRDHWSLCHPVNIYVYKNGITGVPATLVHIPAEKKKNMSGLMEVLQARLKLSVGYPQKLYHINGIRVCRTSELQMYDEYVVVTNLDTRFRCAEYGRPRSPLVVIGPYSRHVRSINVNEQNFNIFNIKKRKNEDKKTKFGYAYSFAQDGFGPSELAYINTSTSSRECGSLCRNIKRCVGCKNSDISPLQPPTTAMPMTSCKTPEEDAFYKKYKAECEQIAPVCPTYNQPTQEMGVSTRDFELELDELAEADVDSEHLLAFINRYKDIGGQLYRMFHDRLNEDSQKAQRDHCLDPDQTWYSEHLFKMFINRMDQKESGRPSGTNSAKANSNDTPGSGSKCSAKTIEFDQLSDTRTGAKAVANSDPNVKHYPLVEVGAQKSLSSLVKHCSVPAGTTKPRDNNKYSNNYKVYNAYASTSQMHTCPEFDDFLKNKLLENLQEKKSSEHHASAISRTSSGNNNNTRKYQWQNEDSVNNLTDSMYDMDRPHQFLQKDTIAEDDFNRQFSRRDLSELSHLPHVTQPSESLDQFTRFSHQHENTLEPTRPWYYDDDVGQNMTTLHDNISRDLSQHFTTFPLSIPSETVIADDEFQILHHHRIHARADRHRPPPQFQNARLLIPTYDNNGNFVHYVFQ